ncbi:YMGG-like glycine zipper-containing protein [Micavibrio aeruginosavorus]|uniref:YMGG-like glycine zipper-containing protein n=1 Tax=Micavibrio aeruginosavorus TaxID=349221 RepID=UPI003F4A85E3
MLRLIIYSGLVIILSACGTSTSDRAISGGAIGAGVGAVGSSVTGGSALTGAVIGGAVGAAAGGLTDEDDIDLGKPVWRK